MTATDEIREPLDSLEAGRDRWDHVETARAAVLEAITDDVLARTVDYRSTRGTSYTSRTHERLRHVVNHSTYRRSQIVAMLRQLGATPPATDLIADYRHRSGA